MITVYANRLYVVAQVDGIVKITFQEQTSDGAPEAVSRVAMSGADAHELVKVLTDVLGRAYPPKPGNDEPPGGKHPPRVPGLHPVA